MNNPFDYIPDEKCDQAFQCLIRKISEIKERSVTEEEFRKELEKGKMLGVLIASDSEGEEHTLYAFSGQLGAGGFHFPGFVGPVFDYLQPDGYFKTKEADIVRQNKEIALFEEGELREKRNGYESEKIRLEAEVAAYKEKCRLSKLERDSRRLSGTIGEMELADMIRQSQFEKAELHRLKKRMREELKPYEERLKEAEVRLLRMKKKRRSGSEDLQKWLFDNFKLLNARGESRSLSEIFSGYPMKIPPSGAGECCAPKLLQEAYLKGLHPIAIAEYWYGRPKDGELRRQGEHYPACRGKCGPVLGWMLQGLKVFPPLEGEREIEFRDPEIIYENEWFCVVNKPAGMLSVPGRGVAPSLQQWLEQRYDSGKDVKMAHRLDQDTSGLIIATFGPHPYKTMQSLFATRKVIKTYIAELDGDYKSLRLPERGQISLPLIPDWLDRPRQRVDFESGKEALTEYEFVGIEKGRSRVIFHPLTGRTHQLRVHSASQQGLGIPIVGDRLYGFRAGSNSQRLHLHARHIEFTFPLDGMVYSFESNPPF
ncbi:MAG: RluA family pseudouridine synthase [Muribaculaceae bacterium]|nr:RluA family pseudouridine synthase [Muribaculaceae bacterium]